MQTVTPDTTTRSLFFWPSIVQTSNCWEFRPATETPIQKTHTQMQSDCYTPSMLQWMSTHTGEQPSLSSGLLARTPKSTEMMVSEA